MKNLIRISICITLALFAVARAVTPAKRPTTAAPTAAKKSTGKKADAKTLVADARKDLAGMIKAARADKGLDAKTAKNKPFWKSTQLIAKSLSKAEKGLAAKNDDFLKGIEQARAAEVEMKTAWELTDSKNSGVIDHGKKLGHAIALLRTDYSKEAARKKRGGELTEKEKANFDRIKAQQKSLLAKIKKLEKEAEKDKALEKGLHRIQTQASHILKEPATVDAYVATLYLLDEQIGLIRGFEYYVDKSWRADYLALAEFTNTYEKNYTEWQSSIAYEWSSVETSVDIYENEEVDDSESMSEEEVSSEDSYAEDESFDMSDDEEDEVAMEEDTDSEVEADDAADEDSMEDASDDEGEDMSDDGGGGEDAGGDDGGD
jgi:hypothetical protein